MHAARYTGAGTDRQLCPHYPEYGGNLTKLIFSWKVRTSNESRHTYLATGSLLAWEAAHVSYGAVVELGFDIGLIDDWNRWTCFILVQQ